MDLRLLSTSCGITTIKPKKEQNENNSPLAAERIKPKRPCPLVKEGEICENVSANVYGYHQGNRGKG